MAYSVTRCDVGGSTVNGYHYEFLCESADDIANLPTGASSTEISRPAPGSLAYIESDSSARYILKISREWGEYPMAVGGGSTGGVMKITLTWNDDTQSYSMDKTAGQILTALQSGVLVFTVDDEYVESDQSGFIGVSFVTNLEFKDGAYQLTDSTPSNYYAATLDDYPTDQQPGG